MSSTPIITKISPRRTQSAQVFLQAFSLTSTGEPVGPVESRSSHLGGELIFTSMFHSALREVFDECITIDSIAHADFN